MDYFPIFCQLQHKACLLVGGGVIAERKARLLLDAGASLVVNAQKFTPQFHHWAQQGQLTLIAGEFQTDLLDGKWLVIAATSQTAINEHVYQQANQRQIFCNVVDDVQHTSFIMPSIIDRSPMIVAVSSGGKAPVLARLLREKLEAWLPAHLGKLAALGGELRQRIKHAFSHAGGRRRFWEKLFSHEGIAQALACDDIKEAHHQVETLLDTTQKIPKGEVVLVGAGPGDVSLLTLAALKQLQHADIVIYDRLVSDEILALIRRDAERLFVGKQAGHHCVPQEQINQILLEQALSGKRVVRLKGGDPFIFGRGGEELEALAQHGITFSVIPGVTAASGCAAYSKIPLTHRQYAQQVCLITGHAKADSTLDWSALSAKQQTLIFYMGLSQAPAIQQQLLAHGADANTPVALIEKGTTKNQRILEGQLGTLAQLAQQAASPSLIIVGQVVSLRQKLQGHNNEQMAIPANLD